MGLWRSIPTLRFFRKLHFDSHSSRRAGPEVYGNSLYKLKPTVSKPRASSAVKEEIIHYKRVSGNVRTFCHVPLAGCTESLMPKRKSVHLQQDSNVKIWSRSFSSSSEPEDRVEVDEAIAQVETDKQHINKYLHNQSRIGGSYQSMSSWSSQVKTHAGISVDGARKLKWDKPPIRLLKFNIDASVWNFGEKKIAGLGGILRDYKGDMILSFVANILASDVEAEYLAVQLALEILIEHKIDVLTTIIETDNEEILNTLSSTSEIEIVTSLPKQKIIEKFLANKKELLLSHVGKESNTTADMLASEGVHLPIGERRLYYKTADMDQKYVKNMLDEA